MSHCSEPAIPMDPAYRKLILDTCDAMAAECEAKGEMVMFAWQALSDRIQAKENLHFTAEEVREVVRSRDEPQRPKIPETTIPVRAYRRARILGGRKKTKSPEKPREVPAIVAELRKHIEATERKLTKYREAADRIAIAHMKKAFVVGGRVRYSTDEGISWREDVVVELSPEGPKLAHAGQWFLCEPGLIEMIPELIEMIPEPCNCQGDEKCKVCFPLVAVNVGEFKMYKCEPPPPIDPRWHEIVELRVAVDMLKAANEKERQRANRLSDECGLLTREKKIRDDLLAEARTGYAVFESKLRSKDNTIKKRDEQIAMLKRYPK